MKTKITIILSIATLLLGGLCVVLVVGEDRRAPIISVPVEDIVYSEGQDESVLLEGVIASDNKDGDISHKVRIYDIAVMDGEKNALVTYAVYDSSYNLGKANKVVEYKPAKSDNAEVTEITTEATKTTEATTEQVTTEESTEEGYDDPPLESKGDPVIRLTTHKVTIEPGGYFNSMDYVEDAVDDYDSTDYLYRNMFMEGYYDKATEGEYELTYYCVDSAGNRSNMAKLMLIVED